MACCGGNARGVRRRPGRRHRTCGPARAASRYHRRSRRIGSPYPGVCVTGVMCVISAISAVVLRHFIERFRHRRLDCVIRARRRCTASRHSASRVDSSDGDAANDASARRTPQRFATHSERRTTKRCSKFLMIAFGAGSRARNATAGDSSPRTPSRFPTAASAAARGADGVDANSSLLNRRPAGVPTVARYGRLFRVRC